MIRILWVEDNQFGGMLPRLLKRKGFEVVRALDGGQAVEMASSEKPDLILMDMSLPVKDGETAIAEIKASETTLHIPIIALTAQAMSSDKQKALKADDVETKPIEFPRLFGKINRLLSIEPSVPPQ
ncbi:MAG: response regulator [Candidatus Parabeggiatoa sp. nov. 1]|nr:MAG: response regulator [Gammaproteobacteria bacterium]